jgi:pSer/pThr/pTyr-binding forkhead associated (FHA) protein
LTIGRGDEADWVILDEDLSRVHAAVLRTWDGVTVSDLGSKNGTRVDGALLSSQEPGCALRDGALVELGAIRLRFSDETERHAAALAPPEQVAARPAAPPRAPSTLMLVGAAIVALALAAAAYLLLAG